MRQLLNTLFVTSEDIYLSLDGENVVANRGGETVARYPLHTLQSIVTFSYAGASPALMGKCAQREIGLAFCSQRGKFLARVSGQMQGNVLLRRMQYHVSTVNDFLPYPNSCRDCCRKSQRRPLRTACVDWRGLARRRISAYWTR